MSIRWNNAVNFSFFLCLAAWRTRSSLWDTLIRLCVRRVRDQPVFPLAPPLRSTGSASGCPDLFASFFATMGESDFSHSVIIGVGSSPSRCGPSDLTAVGGQMGDLPVPA